MSRYYDDELYHHGIKGQRWGVRRFQNPDGSLKAAGAKRYGGSLKRSMSETDSRTGRSKYRTAVSEAKANRKSRDAAIQKRVFAEEERIERGYKRGQQLSDKDYAREMAADNKARADWAASKQQYKSDIKSAKEQYKADMKAERENRKGLSDRQKTALKVGAVAAAAALTAYGIHKYRQNPGKYQYKAENAISKIIHPEEAKRQDEMVSEGIRYTAYQAPRDIRKLLGEEEPNLSPSYLNSSIARHETKIKYNTRAYNKAKKERAKGIIKAGRERRAAEKKRQQQEYLRRNMRQHVSYYNR